MKGIYPVEPRHPKKANKGSTAAKTFYHQKDIQFLLHEPIVNKFRAFKVFVKKLKRAVGKGDKGKAGRLRDNKPNYKLDHIVKERYPTFIDAVRDLDDCMSMCCLFATFPRTKKTRYDNIQLCQRLTVEFLHYVIASKSLRKTFISIKGIYFQAEIMGQTITWIVPHKRGYDHPVDVDYRIMATFVEFYTTMMGFINFKLYQSLGLQYPPQLKLETEPKVEGEEDQELCTPAEKRDESLAALSQTLQGLYEDEEEEDVQLDQFPSQETDDPDTIEKAKVEQQKMQKLQNLFKGCKFFINRECPRETLTFIIRAAGGLASWDSTLHVGSTYQSDDETITHHLIDRPKPANSYLSRYYIQPQWLFDCINARELLPVEDYFPGVMLPPHLSPFVEEGGDDYVPREKREQAKGEDSGIADSDSDNDEEEEEEEEDEVEEEGEDSKAAAADSDDEDDEIERQYEENRRKKIKLDKEAAKEEAGKTKKKKMEVSSGNIEKVDVDKKVQKQEAEEKRLAEMMIPKKKKRLYNKIMYSKKKKAQENRKLAEKRETYDNEQKKMKKKQKKAAAQ